MSRDSETTASQSSVVSRVGPVRSHRLAARLWWATLPYAGWVGYTDDEDANPAPWYAYPLYWLWKVAGKLPGSEPFEPPPPFECTCDWCRGVPGAVFEP